MSFNVGPLDDNHQYLCEISDSDDVLYPEDLVPRTGFTYQGTQVFLEFDFATNTNDQERRRFESSRYISVDVTGNIFQGIKLLAMQVQSFHLNVLFTCFIRVLVAMVLV